MNSNRSSSLDTDWYDSESSYVYSLGTIFLEVLCRPRKTRLRDVYDYLARIEETGYEEVCDMIDPNLRERMCPRSLSIFLETVYGCFKSEERYDIHQIVDRLKEALEIQWEQENLVLTGRLAYDPFYMGKNGNGLASMARRHFNEGKLKDIVDPKIMEETREYSYARKIGPDQDSFTTFSKIAYQCLEETPSERPKLEVVIKSLDKALEVHHGNQAASTINTIHVAGTNVYLDPEYGRTGKLKKESDIYSLGVVLFEIFSGKLAYDSSYIKENEKGLAPVARNHFKNGTLKKILDQKIMSEVKYELGVCVQEGPYDDSLDVFSKIANQCLAKKQADRPTIEVVIEKLKASLYIQDFRDRSQLLDVLIKEHLPEPPFDDMVFDGIKEQICTHSLNTFGMIAFECLSYKREKRPTAAYVVAQLQKALELQEAYETPESKLHSNKKDIPSTSRKINSAKAKKEICDILSKGRLLEDDKQVGPGDNSGPPDDMRSRKIHSGGGRLSVRAYYVHDYKEKMFEKKKLKTNTSTYYTQGVDSA
ncbi:hypothetical protein QVD17_37612 [Tagetes erecta]|uniref:Protein kinase domain-containing protein n=1 Tax=Tagetes erecta TaxID=13708 RepID=A0AAD8JWD3_TARER|nr:hypothetical protein QVD17_37612 [Tagetes erecta]